SGSIGEEAAIELLKKGAVDYVMKDRPGRLSYTVKRALDEAKEKQAKRKTEEKLKLLKRAVEASSVSVIITDAEGTIDYVNPYFCEVTGYSFDEVLGQNPRILKSGHQNSAFYEDLWNTLKTGKEWTGEMHNLKKSGEGFWERAVISPIRDADGKIIHFVAIKEDITDRKKMMEELVATINDKENLVRELAHRSYNNMQVIEALLEYKLLTEPDISLEQYVIDMSSKIRSMALAHRELNKGDHLSKIDLGAYLKTLAHDILENNLEKAGFSITFDLKPVKILLDSAIPLGLAIHDLLSCLAKVDVRHSDNKESHAEIRISSSVLMSGGIEIEILLKGENGAFWDKPIDFLEKKNNFAITVIKDQLAGTITFNELQYRSIKIAFKDNRYEERV
ncbi:PAS domain S-box protein, partial [Balneolaceae bacterium ANBcel3]|nr:PAS domain S-box protein [Balneolaceae bacterium ANBcel3]